MEETILKSNFHTHTYRCNHAVGDVDDYCKSALDQGFKKLGFSDHIPFPVHKKYLGYHNDMYLWRMKENEMNSYLDNIDTAKKEYSSKLKIFKGFECEYFSDFNSYYEEIKSKVDYLVFGAHYFYYKNTFYSTYDLSYTPSSLLGYSSNIIEGIESRYFDFIAHPDLFGLIYHRWDSNTISCSHDIIDVAVSYDLPLEINGLGFLKGKISTDDGDRYRYPWYQFWELVAENSKVKVVINSDAHDPKKITGGFDLALKLVKDLNLNLIELF